MKITFLTYEPWPGVYTILQSTKNLIEVNYPSIQIEEIKIEKQKVFDLRLINKIKMTRPDVLFCGGWDNWIKTIFSNIHGIKKILYWCSPASQIDMGGEIERFIDLLNCLKMKTISKVAILEENDFSSFKNISNDFIFLPVFMNFDELNRLKTEKNKKDLTSCDLFCAPNPRKNIFASMIALKSYTDKIKIYTNYSQNNNAYIKTANHLFKNYENIIWMSRENYLKKIQEMDFFIQPSFSESFNFTAAEHMFYEIPGIISKTMPFSKNKNLEKIVMETTDNLNEICKKIEYLFDENFRNEIGKICKEEIEKINNQNVDIVKNNLFSELEIVS